ncbi:hypothetical protein PHLGIDRAFT_120275 [Phlebiopsis gigantea 11061_1 CR5-6]|uniref:DUF6532 domain-containing protein n=1 Tax=Phlebiopsis gigantea (strain 11061_1 CR5-6) TaxID=745531 RepID=A0A0C3S4B6_PHLG1|nr:hypothetical protein PHLGIDRAFT_120275 [Phlebiopsis gigantea 11061_1 CR5-6]
MSEAPQAKRSRQATLKVQQMHEEQAERRRRAEKPPPLSRKEKAATRRIQQATAGSITSQPVRLVQRMVVPRAAARGSAPLAAPRGSSAPTASGSNSRPAHTTQIDGRRVHAGAPSLPNTMGHEQAPQSRNLSVVPAESLFADDSQVVDYVPVRRRSAIYNLYGLDLSDEEAPGGDDLEPDEPLFEQAPADDEPEDDQDDHQQPPRHTSPGADRLGLADEDGEDSEPLALSRLTRGRKRTHANALGDNTEDTDMSSISDGHIDIDDRLPTLHKINPAATGRGCLKDYDDEAQSVISTAQALYDIFCVIRSAYPNQNTQDKWGKECFSSACRRQEVQYRATPEVIRMITRRGTHLRNRWMGHAREAVKVAYRFKGGNSQETKKKNIKLVHQLLIENSSGFAFPKVELRKPEAQRKAAFKNTHSIGIVYQDVFEEHIGRSAFAFLCTLLDLAIQEWAGGVWKIQALDEDEDIHLYTTHLENLERFERSFANDNLLVKLGKTLLTHVRHRAGAGPLHGDTHASAIPQSVFDSMRENWTNANPSDADYDEPDDSSDEDGDAAAA